MRSRRRLAVSFFLVQSGVRTRSTSCTVTSSTRLRPMTGPAQVASVLCHWPAAPRPPGRMQLGLWLDQALMSRRIRHTTPMPRQQDQSLTQLAFKDGGTIRRRLPMPVTSWLSGASCIARSCPSKRHLIQPSQWRPETGSAAARLQILHGPRTIRHVRCQRPVSSVAARMNAK